MKTRTADLATYKKELNGELPAGTLYGLLYRESRDNGAGRNAAKAVASRRWNATNRAAFA